MLRATLLTAAASLALALPASADTKSYDIDSFSTLDVSAGVTVIFEAGETRSLVAENTKGDFDNLIVENRGDTLVISRKGSGFFSKRNRQNYTITVSGPAVSAIDASSGATLKASGIIGQSVDLQASSGATLAATNIEAGDISLKVSSGAEMDAYGTCTSASISASSGASLEADELACANVEASASSGASVRAHATNRADASASSGASVKLVGGATDITSDRSSGGSVTVS